DAIRQWPARSLRAHKSSRGGCVMKFTRDQIARYFESRFPGHRFTGKTQQMVRCPWHEDRNPSLSVNLEDGVFCCHVGCAHGGIYDFEEKFSGCDRDIARANVAELVGIEQAFLHQQQPIAVYQYHDAHSRLIAEKLRYANGPDGRKDFR